jgi:hypothetical protein
MLDCVWICQSREIAIATGDRLHLKANRKMLSGGRVTNGEFVAVKSVRDDGGIELADGRVLDASFRKFLPGYAVTSYGSQSKTVDYGALEGGERIESKERASPGFGPGDAKRLSRAHRTGLGCGVTVRGAAGPP